MSHDSQSHAFAPTITSTSLILRIQANDPEAWNRFARLYGPAIYNWCRKQRLQPADARDVSQEVVAQVLLKIGRYDRAVGPFRGWLWTITRNKVIDFFRQQGKNPAAVGGTDHALNMAAHADEAVDVELSSSDSPDAESFVGSIFLRALDLLRGEFEPSTIQAFIRFAIDGVSAKDVAREQGWAGSTKQEEANGAKRVRMCKVRVRRRLKDEFGDFLDVPEEL